MKLEHLFEALDRSILKEFLDTSGDNRENGWDPSELVEKVQQLLRSGVEVRSGIAGGVGRVLNISLDGATIKAPNGRKGFLMFVGKYPIGLSRNEKGKWYLSHKHNEFESVEDHASDKTDHIKRLKPKKKVKHISRI